METKLSPRGVKTVSNLVVSLFATISLVFFLFSIDQTAAVAVIAIAMVLASLFLMWFQNEFDSISLLIFFFGTTACFYLFSDIVVFGTLRAISIAVFALLSLFLSNYLLNTASLRNLPEAAIYKIALAILFTEIFWILSFMEASQISKGAITAVLFFNITSVTRDYLAGQFQKTKFAFLTVVSIILLVIVIYRI